MNREAIFLNNIDDVEFRAICPARDWCKVKRRRGGVVLNGCSDLRDREFCVKGRIYRENK